MFDLTPLDPLRDRLASIFDVSAVPPELRQALLECFVEHGLKTRLKHSPTASGASQLVFAVEVDCDLDFLAAALQALDRYFK